MKTGKVPESVLKRAVLNQLRTKRQEVLLGAAVGEDCAALKLEGDEVFVLSTDPITGAVEDIGSLAVHVTLNDLASSGAIPVGILLTALLPEGIEEQDIRAIMAQVEETCAPFQVQVLGGHTEITRAVTQPVLSVTGVGKVKDGCLITTGGARPGQDIVMSKWIGVEGTAIIAREKERELLEVFSREFVRTAQAFGQHLSVLGEAAIAVKSGVSAMHDITEGGIYGALWELAQASGVGLNIEFARIPVRQETIEICEYFDINPYCLISSGSLLMVSDRGHDLAEALQNAGIPASVIGKTTGDNDKILVNNGEISYLNPPKSDELYKIYQDRAE